jgi:hypothetical protein
VAWTNPFTAVAGDPFTASQWNQYGRDNLEYLKAASDGVAVSGFSIRRAANQSINDSSDTLVSFDTELQDFGGWWSSGTTATTPAGAIPSGSTTIGVIYIAQIKFASNATGKREIAVLKEGSEVNVWKQPALDDDVTVINLSDFTTCISADDWTLQVWQNSTGALNLTEARFSVIRIGPAD